jgi:type I restriction-modification system DNA methylase subunit
LSGNNIQGQVSPSDIAELAGVSRGAVSNWRKRADDFPAPVAGSDANPLFDKQEIVKWLEARGHELKKPESGALLWSAMNLLRGSMDSQESSNFLLTLLCARKVSLAAGTDAWSTFSQEPSDISRLNQLVAGLFDQSDTFSSFEPRIQNSVSEHTLRMLVDAISQIEQTEFGPAADFVLERLTKAQIKYGADGGFVGSRISTLLANLAYEYLHGGVLYDPACGIANTLIQTTALGAKPKQLVGQDINRFALRIARLRSYLHDVDLTLINGDVLAEDVLPDLRADVIVLEPSFGLRFESPSALADVRFSFGTPPRSSADLAWIQDVIYHLTDKGRGFVITPLGSLSRTNLEQNIRAELVREGCIEAIVALPGKMLPNTAIPLALWVLRKPTSYADEKILFIDASDEAAPEGVAHKWLRDLSAFPEVQSMSRTIFASEVLAQNANLLPQNWVLRDPVDYEELDEDYSGSFERVEYSIQESERLLDLLKNPVSKAETRTVTVEELLSQDVFKMQIGRTRFSSENEEMKSCITHSSVRNGILPNAASQSKEEVLTLPGDVIVATVNATNALFDPEGGHEVSSGLYRFTQFNTNVLLPEFFTHVVSGSWNKRFQAGSAMQRANAKHLEIPLPSIAEQERLLQVISAANELEKNAKELLANSTEMRDFILTGIRYGVGIEITESSSN